MKLAYLQTAPGSGEVEAVPDAADPHGVRPASIRRIIQRKHPGTTPEHAADSAFIGKHADPRPIITLPAGPMR